MDELSRQRTRWDKFEIMMESHQMMIKDQVSCYFVVVHDVKGARIA